MCGVCGGLCGTACSYICGLLSFCSSPSVHLLLPLLLCPSLLFPQVWRYREKFASHERFYDAAAKGTLPQFSWISPSEQASDHPCNDIRKGERQLKDIYEALRAGPKWNKVGFQKIINSM